MKRFWNPNEEIGYQHATPIINKTNRWPSVVINVSVESCYRWLTPNGVRDCIFELSQAYVAELSTWNSASCSMLNKADNRPHYTFVIDRRYFHFNGNILLLHWFLKTLPRVSQWYKRHCNFVSKPEFGIKVCQTL